MDVAKTRTPTSCPRKAAQTPPPEQEPYVLWRRDARLHQPSDRPHPRRLPPDRHADWTHHHVVPEPATGSKHYRLPFVFPRAAGTQTGGRGFFPDRDAYPRRFCARRSVAG